MFIFEYKNDKLFDKSNVEFERLKLDLFNLTTEKPKKLDKSFAEDVIKRFYPKIIHI